MHCLQVGLCRSASNDSCGCGPASPPTSAQVAALSYSGCAGGCATSTEPATDSNCGQRMVRLHCASPAGTPEGSTMSATSEAILLGIFTLASCIWVGGYVAI